MKSHWPGMVGVVILGLAAGGCSKEGSSGPQGNASGSTAAPAASPNSSAASDAATIVHQFLEALRTGNDELALSLLTTVARQKAIERNRPPMPEADDAAQFDVGEVTMDGDDIAQVHCTWTDLDDAGKPRVQKTIWCCRREAVGWRVGGVAVIAFEGEQPVLLNFENPEEMAKEQGRLKEKEETARRDKRQAAQIPQPTQETGKKPEDYFRR